MGRGARGRGRGSKPPVRAVDFDPTDIFAALNAAKVKYLVVGGIAAIQYGVPRATFDVDLAVQLEVENLERIDRALNALGFAPKVPVSIVGLADPKTRKEWTEGKHMKVFSYAELTAPFRLIDIMVRPLKRFERLYHQRRNVIVEGVKVPLVPIPALIQMKAGTGRVQDQLDIEYLHAAQQAERKRARP